MIEVGRTLYILNNKTYINSDHDCFIVKSGNGNAQRIPFKLIQQVVIFGGTTITDFFLRACVSNGILVSYVSQYGVYYGGFRGKTIGNILLRKRQYALYDDVTSRLSIAKNILLGKAVNQSSVLLTAARNSSVDKKETLVSAAASIGRILGDLQNADSVDTVRGMEGSISNIYFSVFDSMLKTEDDSLLFKTRSRRPPENYCNALLSFLYTMLNLNCISALETFGLDSYLGFLHEIHPGRESLANDLIEEFRAPLVDHFVITLINRQQINASDFENDTEGIKLTEDSRKQLLTLWEEAKSRKVLFRLYKKEVPIRLLPFLQAQLLSQYVRGDIPEYPPWIWEP